MSKDETKNIDKSDIVEAINILHQADSTLRINGWNYDGNTRNGLRLVRVMLEGFLGGSKVHIKD